MDNSVKERREEAVRNLFYPGDSSFTSHRRIFNITEGKVYCALEGYRKSMKKYYKWSKTPFWRRRNWKAWEPEETIYSIEYEILDLLRLHTKKDESLIIEATIQHIPAMNPETKFQKGDKAFAVKIDKNNWYLLNQEEMRDIIHRHNDGDLTDGRLHTIIARFCRRCKKWKAVKEKKKI